LPSTTYRQMILSAAPKGGSCGGKIRNPAQRRRSGWISGTSTITMLNPSRSRICISLNPTACQSRARQYPLRPLPARVLRRRRLAPATTDLHSRWPQCARSQTAQGSLLRGRKPPPCGSATPLAVDVQTEALGVEPKRTLEVGGTHQHLTRENFHDYFTFSK
jgi:hypothetical protein